MPEAIIIVEFADPDFAGTGKLDIFQVHVRKCLREQSDWFMREFANHFGRSRWVNQIMRVHRYNSNLPALIPSNHNRPY